MVRKQQREIIALHRQGTQQQRPESPTVTPPGVRVNIRYKNSTKGTSSKKDAPSGISTFHFRHTRKETHLWFEKNTRFCAALKKDRGRRVVDGGGGIKTTAANRQHVVFKKQHETTPNYPYLEDICIRKAPRLFHGGSDGKKRVGEGSQYKSNRHKNGSYGRSVDCHIDA